MRMLKYFLLPIIIFITLLLIGASVYQRIEGWGYLDSLYFTVITATTIGYGDMYPRTDAGKIFTIFFAFLGIGMALYFFSLAGRYLSRKQFHEKLAGQGRLKSNKGVRRIK